MKMGLFSGLAVILVLTHVIEESQAVKYRNRGDELMSECLRAAHCSLIQGDIARDANYYKNDPKKFYGQAKRSIDDYNRQKSTKDKSRKDKIEKDCKKRYDGCKPWKNLEKAFGLKRKQVKDCTYTSFTYLLFFCKNLSKWPAGYSNIIFGKNTDCENFMPTCQDIAPFEKYHINRGIKKAQFPSDWKDKKVLDGEEEYEDDESTTVKSG